MKSLIALVVLLTLTSTGLAQDNKLLTQGKAMRASGATLTALGATAAISGMVMMVLSALTAGPSCQSGNPYCDHRPPALLVAGGSTFAAGAALAAAIGVPLLSSGNARVRRARLAFSLAPTIGRDGLDGVAGSFKLTF